MTETVKKTARKPKATTANTAAAAKPVAAAAPAKPKKSNLTVMQPPAATINHAPSHDQIKALAHKYWAERGYQHGSDAEDWFRAEQELRGKAS